MKTKLIAAAIVLAALSGCAAIEPNHLRLGAQHLSSATQHFGSNKTQFGFNSILVGAEWEPTKHTYIEVQESWILGDGILFAGGEGHEFFEARAGVQLNLK